MPPIPDPLADGTTTNLGLTLPEIGASENTWGNKTNDNWALVDAIFAADGEGTSVGLHAGAGKLVRIDGAGVAGSVRLVVADDGSTRTQIRFGASDGAPGGQLRSPAVGQASIGAGLWHDGTNWVALGTYATLIQLADGTWSFRNSATGVAGQPVTPVEQLLIGIDGSVDIKGSGGFKRAGREGYIYSGTVAYAAGSSGVFTVPAGVRLIQIEAVGGGGGGGGCPASVANQSGIGRPGSGAAYVSGEMKCNPGETLNYDVGAAGQGGIGGTTQPTDGGDTTLNGTLAGQVLAVNAGGGLAGVNGTISGTAPTAIHTSQNGGTPSFSPTSGALLGIQGGPSGVTVRLTQVQAYSMPAGQSQLGNPCRATFVSTGLTSVTGANGFGYGVGGQAGASCNGGGAANGGDGSGGRLLLHLYM